MPVRSYYCPECQRLRQFILPKEALDPEKCGAYVEGLKYRVNVRESGVYQGMPYEIGDWGLAKEIWSCEGQLQPVVNLNRVVVGGDDADL